MHPCLVHPCRDNSGLTPCSHCWAIFPQESLGSLWVGFCPHRKGQSVAGDTDMSRAQGAAVPGSKRGLWAYGNPFTEGKKKKKKKLNYPGL